MEGCGEGRLAWARRNSPGACPVRGQAVRGNSWGQQSPPCKHGLAGWSRVRVGWHKVGADQTGRLVWNGRQVKLERFGEVLSRESPHSFPHSCTHSPDITEPVHVLASADTAEQETGGPSSRTDISL